MQEIEPQGSDQGLSAAFKQLLAQDSKLFSAAAAFSGVRALAYIREAHKYILPLAPLR